MKGSLSRSLALSLSRSLALSLSRSLALSLSLLLIPGAAGAANLAANADETLEDGTLLHRVATNDGGWQYDWDGRTERLDDEQLGGILWTYDGQQTFYTGYESPDAIMRFNPADGPASRWDVVQQVLDSVRIDRYGRRWIPADYDERMLESALDAYSLSISNDTGLQPDGDPFERYLDLLEADSTEESEDLIIELNWSMTKSQVCDRMWYDTDENTSLTYPMTAVGNKPAVVIGIETGSTSGGGGNWSDYTCSGVLVADDWVLTAAHCATVGTYQNSSYNPAGAFRVCSYGNVHTGSDCTSVSSVVTQSGWLNWHGVADDFVLLHLSGALNYGNLGHLPISAASASTIEASASVITGYPGELGVGSSHCVSNTDYQPSKEDNLDGYQIPASLDGINVAVGPTWDSSSVVDMTFTLHKSANDLGEGWSGAAFRYQPAPSEWYITGLESSAEYVGVPPSVEGAHIGPNHDQFRAWVAANI